jgi:hypothetical protein
MLDEEEKGPSPLLYHLGFIVGLAEGGLQTESTSTWIRVNQQVIETTG